MRHITRHLLFSALVVALLSGLVTTPAQAKIRAQEQIRQYRTTSAELRKADRNNAVAIELSVLNSWLDEAEANLKGRDTSTSNRLLRRARHQVQFIRSLLDAAEAEANSARKMQEIEQIEGEVARNREQIAKLIAERQALQQQARQATPSRPQPHAPRPAGSAGSIR